MIPLHYNKKVWWRCKNCGYEWETSPNNRVNAGTGCPACAHCIVDPEVNSVAAVNPLLAEQWDAEKMHHLLQAMLLLSITEITIGCASMDTNGLRVRQIAIRGRSVRIVRENAQLLGRMIFKLFCPKSRPSGIQLKMAKNNQQTICLIAIMKRGGDVKTAMNGRKLSTRELMAVDVLFVKNKKQPYVVTYKNSNTPKRCVGVFNE